MINSRPQTINTEIKMKHSNDFRLEKSDDPFLTDDTWYLISNEAMQIQVSQIDGTFIVHRWIDDGCLEIGVCGTLTDAMDLARKVDKEA